MQIGVVNVSEDAATNETTRHGRLLPVEFRPRAFRDAFTPEFATPEAKLVWFLRAGLAALAVYSLTVEPKFTTRPLLFLSATWGLVMSVFFAFIRTRRPRTLKGVEAAVLLAFAMHVMGHAFGWYAAYDWYDTALHFSVPLVTALVLYGLSQATGWIWDWRKVTAVEVGIYLFSMAVALGTLWECLEFGMDQIFGTQEQDDLYDTMLDLLMDVAGALIGAIAAGLATHYGRRHGLEKVSEQPKRPYPMSAPRGTSKE